MPKFKSQTCNNDHYVTKMSHALFYYKNIIKQGDKVMKLKPSESAFAIKQSLTMSDVLKKYVSNFEPKKNRISCPIHNGLDYNFSFTESVFHCFVCGASGDIIGFVQQYFDLSFSDAIAKLNNDFCLSLPIYEATSHYDKAKQQSIIIQSTSDKITKVLRKQSADELETEYYVRLRVYKSYCEAVERLKPAQPTETPSAEFLHVLKYRDIAEYKLDECFKKICALGRD